MKHIQQLPALPRGRCEAGKPNTDNSPQGLEVCPEGQQAVVVIGSVLQKEKHKGTLRGSERAIGLHRPSEEGWHHAWSSVFCQETSLEM